MKVIYKIFVSFLMIGILMTAAPSLASTRKRSNGSVKIVNKSAVKKIALKSARQSARNKKAKVSDVVTSTYVPGAPKEYMKIILTARNQYLKSSALAKRRHSASALKAAEAAYNEALEQANQLLSPVSVSKPVDVSNSGQ